MGKLFIPLKFEFVNTLSSDQNDHQFANDAFFWNYERIFSFGIKLLHTSYQYPCILDRQSSKCDSPVWVPFLCIMHHMLQRPCQTQQSELYGSIASDHSYNYPRYLTHSGLVKVDDIVPVAFSNVVYQIIIINQVMDLRWKAIRYMILGLRPANERRRYKVTPSLIGWARN